MLNNITIIFAMFFSVVGDILLLVNRGCFNEEKKETFLTKYIKNGLFIVGIFFAITALTDPSFLALITISGHSQNMIYVILANCIWILISQLPIFVLTIAILFNKHEKIIDYFKNKLAKSDKVEKIKKILSILLSIIILVIGILSIVDSINYWFNSSWLF